MTNKADSKESREDGDGYRGELRVNYYSDEEECLYVLLRSAGMAEVGAREMLSSFSFEGLLTIKEFCEEYGHYFTQERERRTDGSITVDVDVTEALTGLKAVQREARDAARALRELEEARGDVLSQS